MKGYGGERDDELGVGHVEVKVPVGYPSTDDK